MSGGDRRTAGPGTGSEVPSAAPRRWLVLIAGMIAVTAGCTFQYGLAYLIPAFRHEGLSLEQAGILVACPTAGLLLTRHELAGLRTAARDQRRRDAGIR
jgi:hypothetical protein